MSFNQLISNAGRFAMNNSGTISGVADAFFPNNYSGPKGGVKAAADKGYDALANSISQMGGVGSIVGGAMLLGKVAGKITNALGAGTDNMTTADAILGSSFLNLTPVGLINGFGGKRADTIIKDTDAFANVGSSYSGSENAVNQSLTKSGKKYGLFSSGARKRANKLIRESRRLQALVSGISDIAKLLNESTLNMADMINNAYAFNLKGGYDQSAVRAAKRGTKLDIQRISRLAASYKFGGKVKLEEEIQKETPKETTKEFIFDTSEFKKDVKEFKEGGNIIPDGALHARKHNLEKDNPELKGEITGKGIPVITEENGKVIQQAEIERDEWTLRKEFTDKVEDAYKKYKSDDLTKNEKDEISIELGKLIVEELLHNTDDRTGLLNKVE